MEWTRLAAAQMIVLVDLKNELLLIQLEINIAVVEAANLQIKMI